MSRRWILGALMAALMLVMVSSVAYAAFVDCSPNNDTCTGTDQDDLIVGTDDPDLIYALGGGDVIRALEGQDTVFGNTGDDYIHGGLGSDTLRGNKGNDYIQDSTRGNDVDRLFGGRHNDRLYSRDEDNLDTINCGLGFDRAFGYDAGDRIAENCENITQPGPED